MAVQRLCPCQQEAAKAAVAAAAADKAEAVQACAQLELDTAELRERVARHKRTQARFSHAHTRGRAFLSGTFLSSAHAGTPFPCSQRRTSL